jgi:hypothetical protein
VCIVFLIDGLSNRSREIVHSGALTIASQAGGRRFDPGRPLFLKPLWQQGFRRCEQVHQFDVQFSRLDIPPTLRKHGYPPDKQERATQTVLEAALLSAK